VLTENIGKLPLAFPFGWLAETENKGAVARPVRSEQANLIRNGLNEKQKKIHAREKLSVLFPPDPLIVPQLLLRRKRSRRAAVWQSPPVLAEWHNIGGCVLSFSLLHLVTHQHSH
jgi:hypothetical protein